MEVDMWKYVSWIWWRVFYLFAPRPKSYDKVITSVLRQMRPNFSPYIYHNLDGKCWEVVFQPDPDFVVPLSLKVDAHIAIDTGVVVGLTVDEYTLRTAARKEWRSLVDDIHEENMRELTN
jgi:hypothetical protein